jgi:hypothetical protein
MNINLDELGKKLHAKLDSGIDQLKAAKAHLEDVEKETKDAIQTKLNAAKETLEAKKQEASAAKARLEEFVEAKKTETKGGRQTTIKKNSRNVLSVQKNMLMTVSSWRCTMPRRPKWLFLRPSLPVRMLTRGYKLQCPREERAL